MSYAKIKINLDLDLLNLAKFSRHAHWHAYGRRYFLNLARIGSRRHRIPPARRRAGRPLSSSHRAGAPARARGCTIYSGG
eukprot:SAG31_NODE_1548_length_7914_cov_5.353423_9_plen_80_part_00